MQAPVLLYSCYGLRPSLLGFSPRTRPHAIAVGGRRRVGRSCACVPFRHRTLAEATGDPPGLGAAVGVRLKLSSLGAWGLLLSSCRTIADVIRVGPRYYELSENFLRPSIEYQAHAVVIAYADDEVPEDIRGFVIERDLAYNVTSVQSLVGASTPLHITARLA